MLSNVACQQFLSRAFQDAGEQYRTNGGQWLATSQGLLTDVRLWTGGTLAAGCLVLWALTLSQLPISRALPIMALVFVVSPLIAAGFLGDSVRPLNVVGFVLVALGIVLSSSR